jgi:hypothetical protein
MDLVNQLKKFKLGNNNNRESRSASVQTTKSDDKLCSKMINRVIYITDEQVKSRSAFITKTTKPVNETRELNRTANF